jgi:hypothetical protein
MSLTVVYKASAAHFSSSHPALLYSKLPHQDNSGSLIINHHAKSAEVRPYGNIAEGGATKTANIVQPR